MMLMDAPGKNSQESRKAGSIRASSSLELPVAGRTRRGLKFADLSEQIIGAAIAVHRDLGPGFIESIYEQALSVELRARGIDHERQVSVRVKYRDVDVGEHRLDFLVEKCFVLELKAIKALEDVHFAIVRSYLKAMSLEHGLLLNFAAYPLTIKRVLRERPAPSPEAAACDIPDFLPS